MCLYTTPPLAGQIWKRGGGTAFSSSGDFLLFPLSLRARFWIPPFASAQLDRPAAAQFLSFTFLFSLFLVSKLKLLANRIASQCRTDTHTYSKKQTRFFSFPPFLHFICLASRKCLVVVVVLVSVSRDRLISVSRRPHLCV